MENGKYEVVDPHKDQAMSWRGRIERQGGRYCSGNIVGGIAPPHVCTDTSLDVMLYPLSNLINNFIQFLSQSIQVRGNFLLV